MNTQEYYSVFSAVLSLNRRKIVNSSQGNHKLHCNIHGLFYFDHIWRLNILDESIFTGIYHNMRGKVHTELLGGWMNYSEHREFQSSKKHSKASSLSLSNN